jgi:hypothetical protein
VKDAASLRADYNFAASKEKFNKSLNDIATIHVKKSYGNAPQVTSLSFSNLLPYLVALRATYEMHNSASPKQIEGKCLKLAFFRCLMLA